MGGCEGTVGALGYYWVLRCVGRERWDVTCRCRSLLESTASCCSKETLLANHCGSDDSFVIFEVQMLKGFPMDSLSTYSKHGLFRAVLKVLICTS